MKTVDFLRKHDACSSGSRWALSISEDMADVWDAMIEQNRYKWLLWTATRPGVFTESILRKLACRFVRETPLADGGTVWSLLTDERSRNAIEVAEAYADGKATDGDLAEARQAARAAYDAAHIAAHTANAVYYVANVANAANAANDAYYATRAARAARAANAANQRAALNAVYDTAYAAFYAAAYADANAAAWASAKSAQIKMIAEIGNPFNKEA